MFKRLLLMIMCILLVGSVMAAVPAGLEKKYDDPDFMVKFSKLDNSNPFSMKFKEQVSNDKLIEIVDGDAVLSLEFVDKMGGGNYLEFDDMIVYEDAFFGTNIVYEPNVTSLKESIVLYDIGSMDHSWNEYLIRFNENTHFYFDADNSELYILDNGVVTGKIPRPFVIENNGVIIYLNASIELVEEGLLYTIDTSNRIFTNEASYPLTVDPTYDDFEDDSINTSRYLTDNPYGGYKTYELIQETGGNYQFSTQSSENAGDYNHRVRMYTLESFGPETYKTISLELDPFENGDSGGDEWAYVDFYNGSSTQNLWYCNQDGYDRHGDSYVEYTGDCDNYPDVLNSNFDAAASNVPDQWINLSYINDTHINVSYEYNDNNYTSKVVELTLTGSLNLSMRMYGEVTDAVTGTDTDTHTTNLNSIQYTGFLGPQITLNSPADASTVTTSPVTLNVTVVEPEIGENVNVTFYDVTNSVVLYSENNVANGSTLTTEYVNVYADNTYEWYVNATSSNGTTQESYSFSTPSDDLLDLNISSLNHTTAINAANQTVWQTDIDGVSQTFSTSATINFSIVEVPAEYSGTLLDNATAYYGFDNTTIATTYISNPLGEPGKIGGTMNFDGTDDRLTSSGVSGTPDTISLWFNPDNQIDVENTLYPLLEFDGTYNAIWLGEFTGAIGDEMITIPTGSIGGHYMYWDDSTIGTSSFYSGTWYHIVLVWNQSQSKYRLYLDGDDKGYNSVSGTSQELDFDSFSIGERNGLFYYGEIDDIALFDTVADQTMVSELYNSGNGTRADEVDDTNLVYYNDMDALYDSTGNDNDLDMTATNPIQSTTGKLGTSMDFDGTNDWTKANIDTTSFTDYSVSLWFYQDVLEQASIFGGNSGTGLQYSINILTDGTGGIGFTTNSADSYDYSGSYSAGTWNHVAITYEEDGDLKNIWLNGAQVLTDNVDAGTASYHTSYAFGERGDGSYNYDGKLDEFMIFNRAITSSEISELYNTGVGFDPYGASGTGITSAYCAISDEDVNYTTMVDGSGSDCSSGLNVTDHTCTYSGLTLGVQQVYISCTDPDDNSTQSLLSTSGPLNIELLATSSIAYNELLPADNSQTNVTSFGINASVNSSSIFNCSLVIDSVVNQTSTDISAGNNTLVNFNVDFGSDTSDSFDYYFSCTDVDGTINSSTYTFVVDDIVPDMSYTLSDYSIVDNESLNVNITMTDDRLYYYELYIDGGLVNDSSISGTSYVLNWTYNTTNLTIGDHTLDIVVYDGVSSTLNTYSETVNFYVNRPSLVDEDNVLLLNIDILGGTSTSSLLKWQDTLLSNDNGNNDVTISTGLAHLTSVGVKIDNGSYTTYNISGSPTSYTLAYNISSIDLDAHTLYVNVTQNPSEEYNVTIQGINATYTYESSVIRTQEQSTTLSVNSDVAASFSNAVFYNNVSQSLSSETVGDLLVYTSTFNSLTNDSIAYIDWYTNVTIGNTTYENVEQFNQSVNQFAFDNCSTYNNTALTFYHFNEENITQELNASIKVTLNVSASQNSGELLVNLVYPIAENHSICIDNNSNPLYLTGNIEYSSDTYSTRKYFMEDLYLAANSSETINLYYINDSRASDIIHTVLDNSAEPVKDAIIKILRYDYATGNYYQVETIKTDHLGKSSSKQVLTEYYKYLIEAPAGTVRYNSDSQKLISADLEWIINIEEDVLDSWERIDGVSTSLTCTNSTRVCRFTWSDSAGLVQDATIKIYHYNNFDRDLIHEETVSASSGSIVYTLPDTYTEGTIIAKGYIETNTQYSNYFQEITEWVLEQGSGLKGDLNNVIPVILVILTLGLLFIDIGGEAVIVGSMIGLVGCWALGLINMGFIPIISFVILGGILAVKVNQVK